MMRKGQIVVVGRVEYDPTQIDHFDFGKNQFGQRRCRCTFNGRTKKRDEFISSKEDYGVLLEFAETNELIQERNLTFRE